ncbi:MAG: 16S rRNA (guanine(966)-N(2))-methyltransferase RsmD [Bacteroidaceae bacterium]|nr:16S rRNA (guanine(966)-N(2))-methyltransferase RsmD [Bacteroidaceae bacterium]
MRIISGKYKGRHFDVPRTFKARPTTDFAKENLFNILNNIIDFEECTALDLFSGTGSISLELLSRGCKEVMSVEMDQQHFGFLKKCQHMLGDNSWRMVRDDVFRFLRRCNSGFDLVFADPPYALKGLPDIPDLVLEGNALNDNGIFIFEHGKDYNFEEHPHFMRHIAYGSVNFTFFSKEKQNG